MTPKEYVTNKAFCPVPWTGLMYNFDGKIKTCIRSSDAIGDLKENSVTDILQNQMSTENRKSMMQGAPAPRCTPCYNLESNTNGFDIISDRVFYLKKFKKSDLKLFDDETNFDLKTIDVRWSNLCNFACVYCGPQFSSKWSSELNVIHKTPSAENFDEFKKYIFDRVENLEHVYLAGGEPLLIKENFELLTLLKEKNHTVDIRVNTNLSKVDTKIFQLLGTFPNVHWTVSVETIGQEFEYIRYGSNWKDFEDNLQTIKNLNHRVSFNMLYFALNYLSIFPCLDYLRNQGFHNNSFVIGALLNPDYLNIRQLPEHMLNSAKSRIEQELNKHPGFLLENGLRNVLEYIQQPVQNDINLTLRKLNELDARRGLDSRAVFTQFYKEIERQ